MYDDTALERLQQILLFKELQFTLKEIKAILDSPDFDRGRVLEQQIQLLELRKEHLQNLIDLARGIKMIGVKHMSFEAFDTRKFDEYVRQAKASWGQTDAYKEYEKKSVGRSKEEQHVLNEQQRTASVEKAGAFLLSFFRKDDDGYGIFQQFIPFS